MKIQAGELKKAETFIAINLNRLVEWSVGDIKKCCRMQEDGTCEQNGSLVGSFILWSCAIDYFGGLYTGRATLGETERRFRDFVTKYMKDYDYKKLLDLRWALLHFYSSRHYSFHQSNDLLVCQTVHLTESSDGILLDLYCSIRDLEIAVKNYIYDLTKSNELKVRLYRYYEKSNPLMPLTINYDQLKPKYSPVGGFSGRSGNSAGTTTFR
jgi:hypothetical protein